PMGFHLNLSTAEPNHYRPPGGMNLLPLAGYSAHVLQSGSNQRKVRPKLIGKRWGLGADELEIYCKLACHHQADHYRPGSQRDHQPTSAGVLDPEPGAAGHTSEPQSRDDRVA